MHVYTFCYAVLSSIAVVCVSFKLHTLAYSTPRPHPFLPPSLL